MQPGAFSGSAAESVTLFDSLQQISDYAFEDCTSLQTLYINAATAPVYSGSYYATFADKYDRLTLIGRYAEACRCSPVPRRGSGMTARAGCCPAPL